MKIIHSYWSKPNLIQHKESQNLGGWTHRAFNYMSWALSCLKFKEFYPNIELVTDQKGKELLIDQLELPYTSVKVVLDDLNDYSPHVWAIGKIYAYSIQEEPFIHVDNDVYIWKRFSERIEKANLVAQHREENYKHNDDFFNDVQKNFEYIPSVIQSFRKKDTDIKEVNAGILGGHNLDFYKKYTQKAFEFVDKNHDFIKNLKHKGMFNTIFEQYLYYCMASENNLDIEYLITEKVPDDFAGLANFFDLPNKTTYIHTVGSYKKNFKIGDYLSQRLFYEYPDYYNTIINKIKTHQL